MRTKTTFFTGKCDFITSAYTEHTQDKKEKKANQNISPFLERK